MSTPITIASFLLVSGLFCCSASDEAPFGGRVDSPANKDPKTPTSAPSIDPSLEGVHPGPPYPTAREGWWPDPPFPVPTIDWSTYPPRPSTWWGLKLTPLQKVISDTCPTQRWSQNVPDIPCTKDSECGDGFCDRGQCGPIWTCGMRASLPCEKPEHCWDLLCIEGRCQSCVNDEECNVRYGGKGYMCNLPDRKPHDISACGRPAPRFH